MARKVAVTETFAGTVHEAELCWYEVDRWPMWVEGLAEVLEVRGGWPDVGASVVWRSGPAGRGTVIEKVLEYEALSGQTVEVSDDSIRGRQRVWFTPAGESEVEITLQLEYELKDRSLFARMANPLFIRRAFRTALGDTLGRFGSELAGARSR